MKNILVLITMVGSFQNILAQKQNLVNNGSFETGSVAGVNTDYNLSDGHTNPGEYDVTEDAAKYNHGFVNPSPSTGPFLYVDGYSGSFSKRVWYDSVIVEPNTTYIFSCLAANILINVPNSNPAILKFNVNGKKVSRLFYVSPYSNNWQTIRTKYTTSGDQKKIEISIVDINDISQGNDFAIDNIFFGLFFGPEKETLPIADPLMAKTEKAVAEKEIPVEPIKEPEPEKVVAAKKDTVGVGLAPTPIAPILIAENAVKEPDPVKPVVEKKIVPTPVKKEVEKKQEPVVAKVIEKKPIETPKLITPPKEKKILLQPVKKEKKLEPVVVAKIDLPKKIEKKKDPPVKKVEPVVTVPEVVTKPVEAKKDSVFATASVSFKKDMNKQMIQVGQKLELSHIYFERGKSALLNTSMPELNDLVSFMNKYPTIRIRLEGHTDNQGNPLANKELSENRVKETKKYLVEHGIAEDRIEWVGYGGERALNSNRVEALRKLNRRVEVVIIDK
jgi:outer membrane protein OmpA-like peptidoglycan-associated protein